MAGFFSFLSFPHSASWRRRRILTKKKNKIQYVAKFAADDQPDWNAARLVAVDELLPGSVKLVTLEAEVSRERVPLRKLDDLGLSACHFMKIDVEGMEVEALRGGANLVAQHRPTLYAENDRKERSAELISLLLSFLSMLGSME